MRSEAGDATSAACSASRGCGRTEPIGLLAGSGRFPILFAEAARRQGLPVACVGIKYEASEELRSLCDSFEWVGVAKLGRMIRAFKRCGTKRIVMAGKVTKNVIYTPWRILQLCPDLRTLQWWYRRTRADNRDDSILLSLISEFERDGMTFRLGPRFLPGATRERRHPDPAGADARPSKRTSSSAGRSPRKWAGSTSASRSPSRSWRRWPSRPSKGPIAASSAPASSAGRADGRWSRSPSPSRTCDSTCRPIGVTTIENLHKAGAKVLAIEAGKTILLDEPEVIALADRYGLSIVAIQERRSRSGVG